MNDRDKFQSIGRTEREGPLPTIRIISPSEISFELESVEVKAKTRLLSETSMGIMIEYYLRQINDCQIVLNTYDDPNTPRYNIYMSELIKSYEGLIRMMTKKIKKKHCQ